MASVPATTRVRQTDLATGMIYQDTEGRRRWFEIHETRPAAPFDSSGNTTRDCIVSYLNGKAAGHHIGIRLYSPEYDVRTDSLPEGFTAAVPPQWTVWVWPHGATNPHGLPWQKELTGTREEAEACVAALRTEVEDFGTADLWAVAIRPAGMRPIGTPDKFASTPPAVEPEPAPAPRRDPQVRSLVADYRAVRYEVTAMALATIAGSPADPATIAATRELREDARRICQDLANRGHRELVSLLTRETLALADLSYPADVHNPVTKNRRDAADVLTRATAGVRAYVAVHDVGAPEPGSWAAAFMHHLNRS
jgi:hypothetical protein